jgi:hypothetical protein
MLTKDVKNVLITIAIMLVIRQMVKNNKEKISERAEKSLGDIATTKNDFDITEIRYRVHEFIEYALPSMEHQQIIDEVMYITSPKEVSK